MEDLGQNVSLGMLIIVLVTTLVGTGLKVYKRVQKSSCVSGCCSVDIDSTPKEEA